MTSPILFVDHAPALGGAERSLLMLLRHLDHTRWQPHLAGVGGPLLEEAALHNIQTHQLRMSRLRKSLGFPVKLATTAQSLADLAKRIGAAAIYSNTVRASLYAALAGRLAGKPFVWHMRDFWLSESKPRCTQIDTTLKWLLCRTATRVVVNSHAVARHIPDTGNISVVHNGIELDAFDPALDGVDFRKAHDLPDRVPLVGMIGRLRPWKGQTRFLQMAAQVRAGIPAARFVIVGGAPFGRSSDYTRQLRRLTQTLNLSDCVTFTGHLDDVTPALAAMDVFVHPGDPEPFGLVNIEAMAMQRPVVAFAHGALPEIVVDGKTGLLVPPNQVAALAQAVIDLLESPERAHALGTAGRQRVEQQFTIQHTVHGVEAILSSIL